METWALWQPCPRLLGQENRVDVRKDTTMSNGNTCKQLAKLFIIPHSQKNMSWNDPVLLVVSSVQNV